MRNDDVFAKWLNEQLLARNWSQAEFARHAKVSRATVNKVIKQTVGRPSMDTCKGFARALGLPESVVLRRAGWISGEITEEPPPGIAELNRIFRALSPKSQAILLGIAQVVQKNDE